MTLLEMRRMDLSFPIHVHPSQCHYREEESWSGEEAQLLEFEHFPKAQQRVMLGKLQDHDYTEATPRKRDELPLSEGPGRVKVHGQSAAASHDLPPIPGGISSEGDAN